MRGAPSPGNGLDLAAALLGAIVVLTGCASAPRGEDPSDGMAARGDRAARGDLSVVPELCDALDSEDPGVRAYAHSALLRVVEKAWGRRVDFGYRAWAPREERLERIAEIRAFWRRLKGEQGELGGS